MRSLPTSLPVPVQVALLALAGFALRFVTYVAATGDADPGQFIARMCAFDCAWYAGIVEAGYAPATGDWSTPANWAFFPLYPLLVWLVKSAAFLPTVLAGAIVSSLCTIAAAIVARPWFRSNDAAWRLFAFCLFLGPASPVYSILYTEALFGLLTVLTLVALGRGRFIEAGAWAALLSATRVTGIVMAVAIGVLFLHRIVTSARPLPEAIRDNRGLLLAAAVAPLGLVAYMAFLWLTVGDPLAFLHVQAAWERVFQPPWITLLQGIVELGQPHRVTLEGTAYNVAMLLGLALGGVLLIRGRVAEGAFCIGVMLVSMTAGTGSMVRFAAGLLPLGMLACEILSRWRPTLILAYPAAAAIGTAATWFWLHGQNWLV